jgi:hypothetical protein
LQLVWWGLATVASGCSLCGVRRVPAWLRLAVHVLFSICVPAAILVSIVLWGVLFPHDVSIHNGSYDLNWDSYNQHALNTLFLLIELATNRLLIRKDAIPLLLLWCVSYCGFVWLFHYVLHPGSAWPYFFMAVDTWEALGWYPALLAMHIALYGLVLALSHLKARLRPELNENTTRVLSAVSANPMDATLLGVQPSP